MFVVLRACSQDFDFELCSDVTDRGRCGLDEVCRWLVEMGSGEVKYVCVRAPLPAAAGPTRCSFLCRPGRIIRPVVFICACYLPDLREFFWPMNRSVGLQELAI